MAQRFVAPASSDYDEREARRARRERISELRKKGSERNSLEAAEMLDLIADEHNLTGPLRAEEARSRSPRFE